MWDLRRLRIGSVVVALGVVSAVLTAGTAVPAPAQETTSTLSPRPQPQTTGAPKPIPRDKVALSLPEDMYLHEGAPTEWWYFIGTLHSGSRTFGFEINAASFAGQGGAFSQLSLTDVRNQRNYGRTTPYLPGEAFNASTWAERDPKKDWNARLGSTTEQLSSVQVDSAGTGYTHATVSFEGNGEGASGYALLNAAGGVAEIYVTNPGTGYTTPPSVVISGDGTGATATAFNSWVVAEAPASDPTKNIHVRALLVDDPTMEKVKYDLTFSQIGRPFYIWGTGVDPSATHQSVVDNNYYYSFTKLQAKGTITFGGKKYPVEGLTWMDHEYGAFGSVDQPVQWILQHIQLSNGWTVQNVDVLVDGTSGLSDAPAPGYATLQNPDGKIYFVAATTTQIPGSTWTSSRSGKTYPTSMKVDIPLFDAQIVVTSLVDSQEFVLGPASVYEGVAKAKGTFRDKPIGGQAWIEERI
jgi:predicted secreted hydrolase